MHRISTDKEFLESGRIVINADGIPVDVPDRAHMEAADVALGQRIDKEKWKRSDLTSGSDINSLEPGIYSVPSGPVSTALGLPEGWYGTIETQWVNATGSIRLQVWEFYRGGALKRYTRQLYSGAWSAWSRVGYAMEWLSTTSDMTALAPGEYSVPSVAVGAGLGLPDGYYGVIHVHWINTTGTLRFRTWRYVIAGVLYEWHSNFSGGVWGEWVKNLPVDVPEPAPESEPARGFDMAIRRDFLVNKFMHRRGGALGVSGKAVVALRFDHHLSFFRDKVLPLLVERELPWAQIINPDNIGSGNDQVSWSDIQTWALNHGGEVWNHGATHIDVTSPDELESHIVGALGTLSTNLPKLAVEGFAPIGMNPGGYDGFFPGNTAEQWQTKAGQLILANHAVASGDVAGMYRPLNGRPAIGLSHGFLDTATVSTIDGFLNSLRPRHGMALLLHPNFVDKDASSITTATLTHLLDELVRRRDAGEVEILTYSALYMADGESAWRDNLLTSSTSTGTYRTTIFFSRTQHPKGSVRELVADVTMPAAGDVTVTLGSVVRVHSLPEGDSTLRMVTTIPVDATSMLVEIAGAGSTRDVRLQAI